MGVTTLDMVNMEQQIDSLGPETSKRYMHHYNFRRTRPVRPAASGRRSAARSATVRSPSGPRAGAADVARSSPTRSVRCPRRWAPTVPTSMGSVCASTLSLLNAGVPLRAPVAGIAMGLVSDDVDGETRYVALTDILGAEDAFGDMDFKVAGTKGFVTALQLDTKLDGIPSHDVLAGALRSRPRTPG